MEEGWKPLKDEGTDLDENIMAIRTILERIEKRLSAIESKI